MRLILAIWVALVFVSRFGAMPDNDTHGPQCCPEGIGGELWMQRWEMSDPKEGAREVV